MFKRFLSNLTLISLLFWGSQAWADVVSLDSNYVPGQVSIVTKLNNDRTALVNGVNNVRGVFAGSVQTSGQVKARTIGEENMAPDANPRIRTAENASCTDLVSSGLLPTTSASLVGTIPVGVAYPDGYRIEKTDSTAHTFTASKWTWVYINTSGSFVYDPQSIGASTPTAPANSALLARVSSDGTTINDIQDLRITSCTTGPFDIISDAAGEANLDDMFAFGRPIMNRKGSEGFLNGLHVSYDTATTFLVTKGSTYINGEFRRVSVDIAVPQTVGSATDGTHGIDTGAIANSTRYYVYLLADQNGVKDPTVLFSTNATTPTGGVKYRKIGSIKTNGSGSFVSSDVTNINNVMRRLLVSSWVLFNQTGSQDIMAYNNVSSIADGGEVGQTDITWDEDYVTANYAIAGSCQNYAATTSQCTLAIQGDVNPTAGGCSVNADDDAGSQIDSRWTTVLAIGDQYE